MIEKEEERKNCSLVFRETVSNNSYIYREELLQKGLEFLPSSPMDIEKPASVSKDQTFIWRLSLEELTTESDLVKQVVKNEDGTYTSHIAYD